uniref:Uncharacterized protein n=1 Tax=Solanum tuberosum TaxID=4113 RepID=M1DXA2_SOLTU
MGRIHRTPRLTHMVYVRSASPILSAVWTPKFTGGSVTLGEVNHHSAYHRVVQCGRLIPLKGPRTESSASWVELVKRFGDSPTSLSIALNFIIWLVRVCNFRWEACARRFHSATLRKVHLIALSAPLTPKTHYKFRRASLSSPSGVGDSPKGPELPRPALFLGIFQAIPFGEPDLARQNMAWTNLDESGMTPLKRARGIVINEVAHASTTKGGKGKGKAPVAARLKHNSGSDRDSFNSQASLS